VPREDNPKANALAQQEFGYNVQKINFWEQKPTFYEAVLYPRGASQIDPPTGLTGVIGLTDLGDRSD
jgi:hypothetical protein